jgi:homoserine kinase
MPSHSFSAFTPRRSGPTKNVFRAFAPGGIGNLGPGIDILGCAVTGPGDVVEATAIDGSGVRIDAPGHPDLPTDPEQHASGVAAIEVLRRAQATTVGVALNVEKRLPLAGGQGGSAASAIAGAVAVNALLGSPLDNHELLLAALVAEERVAGRHLDNLAPALLGGIVLVRSIEPLILVRLPVPPTLRVVLVHPEMHCAPPTRARTPVVVDRATAMAKPPPSRRWSPRLQRRSSLLRGAVDDRIAEPARAQLLPGFLDAKAAALGAGALGCSIAGGGPSAFALVDGDASSQAVLTAMLDAYQAGGMQASGRVAQIDERGARIEHGETYERPGPLA